MGFDTNSEYMILIAKSIGIISMIMVLIISAFILILRFRLIMRENRARRLNDVWQPVLVKCLDGLPNDLPELDPRDITTFLVLWNYFHETLRDAGKEDLNKIARTLNLDEWSLKCLSHGSIRERLLAVQTLGWLHEERCWDQLVEIMATADPVTSLCAAKALLRTDAAKGVEQFILLVAIKSEWSYATVGKLLKETGAEIVTKPLLDIVLKSEGENLVRLLRFIDIAFKEQSAPVVSRLLRESKEIDVITSCLRAVSGPEDLPIVRKFLRHEDWRIRTQAAICLGLIGTDKDIPRLVHAAGDQNWWVRYRAAIALSLLPSVNLKRLKSIADGHYSIFGSDVINKVRQEKEAFQ